jgi:hypothetical protein
MVYSARAMPESRTLTRYGVRGRIQAVGGTAHLGVTRLIWGIPDQTCLRDRGLIEAAELVT